MTEMQQRRSMPRRAVAIAVAAVVTFGLIAAIAVFLLAREPEKLAVATPSATLSASAAAKSAAAVPADPSGVEACRLVRSATAANQLMDPATGSAIEAAANSSIDRGIYFSGHMLKDRQELAIAAKGRNIEFEYTLKVLETASEMAAKCAQGGYFG